MPLRLGADEADRYLDRHASPPSFLDMVTAAGYRSAVAGLRLGVFAALRDEPRSLVELAEAVGADPRGLGLLAEVLVDMGYLTRDGDTYANTPGTAAWLAQGEAGYALVELFWQRVLFQLWDNLEDSIRVGKPATDFYAWLAQRPDSLRHFQTMLGNHAKVLAPEIVDAVPVPPDGTLLDLGGGHARYAAALCAHHTGLRATVMDLPDALALGTEVVAEAGVADRVTLTAGDYTQAALGTGFDTVLLFNVLHGYDAAANRQLLRRVAAALAPDGTVVILEHRADPPATEGVTGAAFLRVFSLNLFHGQGGQVYPLDEIGAWLAEAGFDAPAVHPLRASPTQHLLIARLARRGS
jgi:SAM-dependent methyltransferase